jgi:isocitrate/isopropylmalate dehydrogenase
MNIKILLLPGDGIGAEVTAASCGLKTTFPFA